MASSFCPKCGTPRVGNLRFCPSCKLDIDEVDRVAGTDAAPRALASNAPATPQSYSEKYAGTQWAATPLPVASVREGNRRSLGGVIAIVGLAGVAVVAGLVVLLAARGLGGSPVSVPATPPAVSSATEMPPAAAAASLTPSPTSSAAAASRFRVVEDAYLKAYGDRHDTLPTTGTFASYAQARSYYRAEVQNLRRFGTNVGGISFPSVVTPDATVLLQRISEEATLMEKLAATEDETAGWKINEKIMAARTAMNAARVVVGKDLGLTYAEPSPTPKPTAKPTPKPTPSSGLDQADRNTATAYTDSASQTYEIDLPKALSGLSRVSSCTTGEECYYAGQEQNTYKRIALNAINLHLAFMKSNPAAPCFRDAYAADQNIAKTWVTFLSSGSGGSSGDMRYQAQVLAIYQGATDQFIAAFHGYFTDCR